MAIELDNIEGNERHIENHDQFPQMDKQKRGKLLCYLVAGVGGRC